MARNTWWLERLQTYGGRYSSTECHILMDQAERGSRCQHQHQSLADSSTQLGSMSHRSQTLPNNATDCTNRFFFIYFLLLLALGSPLPILVDLGYHLRVEQQHSPPNQKCAKGQAQKNGPPPPTSSICRLAALSGLLVVYAKVSRGVDFFLMSPSQIQIIDPLHTFLFLVNFWKSLDVTV